ncbi:MAG: diguanylate cyclase [Acidobacteriia bacterium]|nr:diguanylate cyclase [Terriglobia bacterium]
MSQLNATRGELQEIISQLQQAIYNHQQWHDALVRTLVCRLPGDRHDMSPKAHRECRFGQWYYTQASEKLQRHSGFVAIGEAHLSMHQLAARLLVAASSETPLPAHDYDSFANALERMRLEIFALEREVESSLYNRDALTGALNRVGVLETLREQQEMVKRQVQTCCIAMMDLDNFKNVNDLYGHRIGDQVLTVATRYVMEHLRPYDKVFRYGGEEFVLCLQHIELTPAYDIVERVRKGLAATPIDIGLKEPIHFTASFGVVLLDPELPVEQSIDRADKAMYAAKCTGRNCVRMWSSDLS